MTKPKYEMHALKFICCDCEREIVTRQPFPRGTSVSDGLRLCRKYHRCSECSARRFRSQKIAVSFQGEMRA